jgi:hypothetical protein
MEIRVELASRFLSALISGDPKRSIESRLPEVRHALLLADVLIAYAAQPDTASLQLEDIKRAAATPQVAKCPALEPEVPHDNLFRHLPISPYPTESGGHAAGRSLH